MRLWTIKGEAKLEILLTQSIDLEQVADLCAVGIKRKPQSPRDHSKFHVTNLLESAHQITKGNIQYHEYQGHPVGIMSLGRIWESAMDCHLTQFAVDNGGFYIPDIEQERDGIIASLDGLILLPEFGLMVAETKLRFTLNREMPFKHSQQVKAYCYLAGVDLVCYVSGHLSSTPPTAEACLRVVRFTKESICETWEGIIKTKEYLEQQGCVPCSGNEGDITK